MIAVNTSINTLMAQNYSRLNQLEFKEKTERLSSGMRINQGADDPSGLAISSGMQAQIRGINVAVHNSQDALNLIRLADQFMDTLQDQFMHMRDLSVRLANQATVNVRQSDTPGNTPALFSDAQQLHREIEMEYDRMERSFSAELGARIIPPPLSFNGKSLFDNYGGGVDRQGFADPGQVIQAGPDNDSSHQIDLILSDIADITAPHSYPYDPPEPADQNGLIWYVGYAREQIDTIDQKIEMLNKVRVETGTIDINLQHTIDDLSTQMINISNANSRIQDADFAQEITALTKNQIVKQSGTIIHSQASAESLITIPLLDAIYDGLLTNQN